MYSTQCTFIYRDTKMYSRNRQNIHHTYNIKWVTEIPGEKKEGMKREHREGRRWRRKSKKIEEGERNKENKKGVEGKMKEGKQQII